MTAQRYHSSGKPGEGFARKAGPMGEARRQQLYGALQPMDQPKRSFLSRLFRCR